MTTRKTTKKMKVREIAQPITLSFPEFDGQTVDEFLESAKEQLKGFERKDSFLRQEDLEDLEIDIDSFLSNLEIDTGFEWELIKQTTDVLTFERFTTDD